MSAEAFRRAICAALHSNPHFGDDEIVAEARALQAEVRRLQAGGCARDQTTTQYCAEVIARDAEIGRLRAEVERLKVLGPDTEARITIEARAIASDLLAPVTESWRAHAAKIEAERDELRIKVAQQEHEIRAAVEAFERYGNPRAGKDLGAAVEELHTELEKARATP